MKLGSPAAMSKEPGGPADAPGHVGLSIEDLEAENARLRNELKEAREQWGPDIQKLLDSLGPVLLERRAALELSRELILELKCFCADPNHDKQLTEIDAALSK